MIKLLSGNTLDISIELNPNEMEKDEVMLYDHCLLTPSNFNFKVIGSENLNFKYRGKLFLLNNKIIFKGFEINLFSVKEDQELKGTYRPICELDYSTPINIEIELSKIQNIYMGHDNTFKKRYFNYPKLKISYKKNNKIKILYIVITKKDLLIESDKINERFKKWMNKIKIKAPKVLSEIANEPEVINETKTIEELSTILSEDEDEIKPAPEIPLPKEKPIARKQQNIKHKPKPETKLEHKTKKTPEPVKPFKHEVITPESKALKTEKKSKPKIGRVVIESEFKGVNKKRAVEETSSSLISTKTKDDKEKDKNVLYEVLKPTESIEDTFRELTDIQPDSSVNRCKKCGWIIKYDQLKCPRCGADTY
ncbi:MAG: hypothetical protein GF329_01020 [Candidatus Lokiarchaeota archaeon]|nr:hypothetical protein [Candidatus Lokiarchaeota archaeon]